MESIHSFIHLFASDQWSISRKTTTAEERKRQKHAYTQTPKKRTKIIRNNAFISIIILIKALLTISWYTQYFVMYYSTYCGHFCLFCIYLPLEQFCICMSVCLSVCLIICLFLMILCFALISVPIWAIISDERFARRSFTVCQLYLAQLTVWLTC